MPTCDPVHLLVAGWLAILATTAQGAHPAVTVAADFEDAAMLHAPTLAARLDSARELRARVRASYPHLEVLPPLIPVDESARAFDVASFCEANPDCPLVFETRGRVTAAAEYRWIQLEAGDAEPGS